MTGTNINMRSERMPIGDGYSVTFSFASGRLEADWQPNAPYGRKGRKYLPAYRRARDEFIRRMVRRTGLNIMVVDL